MVVSCGEGRKAEEDDDNDGGYEAEIWWHDSWGVEGRGGLKLEIERIHLRTEVRGFR